MTEDSTESVKKPYSPFTQQDDAAATGALQTDNGARVGAGAHIFKPSLVKQAPNPTHLSGNGIAAGSATPPASPGTGTSINDAEINVKDPVAEPGVVKQAPTSVNFRNDLSTVRNKLAIGTPTTHIIGESTTSEVEPSCGAHSLKPSAATQAAVRISTLDHCGGAAVQATVKTFMSIGSAYDNAHTTSDMDAVQESNIASSDSLEFGMDGSFEPNFFPPGPRDPAQEGLEPSVYNGLRRPCHRTPSPYNGSTISDMYPNTWGADSEPRSADEHPGAYLPVTVNPILLSTRFVPWRFRGLDLQQKEHGVVWDARGHHADFHFHDRITYPECPAIVSAMLLTQPPVCFAYIEWATVGRNSVSFTGSTLRNETGVTYSQFQESYRLAQERCRREEEFYRKVVVSAIEET